MTTPDNGSVTAISEKANKAENYPIDIAFADYDRTRPIIDGRVKPKGIALKVNTSWIGDFCRRPVYEEYDAAEMSFSWYVGARDRNEPVIALPVFLLRMPVWAFVYVRSDSPITKPSDLIGKRIGSRGYRQTVNLWLRGLFSEHYGLSPEQVTWVTAEEIEGAGYIIPKNIKVEIQKGSSAIANLKNGNVDAMFCTSVPKEFINGEHWIRRLFVNAEDETQSFVRRTGIMPITHVLVMNKHLAEREPWIAQNLHHAFVESQLQAEQMCQVDPKCLSLFDSVYILEQQRARYGSHPYVHGIKENRKTLETFIRYAHEQGYISRRMSVEDFFVPATHSL
jgi:4,5-dihydroxyphthalate decarboxylase